MITSAYEVAKRFIGVSELAGQVDNPQIMAMLKLDNTWPNHDEVPWCSAFVNYIAWLLGLPRSRDLRARSWLLTGGSIPSLDHALMNNDVIVLSRGGGDQPGPNVIEAPGHVGFYAGRGAGKVKVLGGNQGNSVSIAEYDTDRILGIMRLEA